MRLDFSLARAGEIRCRPVPGGHELTQAGYAPRVHGDLDLGEEEVARLCETYEGWAAQDYERAALRLRRRVRNTLFGLARQSARESD